MRKKLYLQKSVVFCDTTEIDMGNIILNCCVNNFLASVECVDMPSLRYVPMAICGDPALQNGSVIAKNDEARKCGVVTGEPSRSAVAKCPSLVIVRPDYSKYKRYSDKLFEIFKKMGDTVYFNKISEGWIDVSSRCETIEEGLAIAEKLKIRVRKELSLSLTVGVSYNFVFSKLASDLAEGGIYSISKNDVESTVWPLQADKLISIGDATKKLLRGLNINTIGDLAAADPTELSGVLGDNGFRLWSYANGNDSGFDPMASGEFECKSVANSVAPSRPIIGDGDARAFLFVLSETIANRLDRMGVHAERIGVFVKTADEAQFSRFRTFSSPTADKYVIYENAYDLLCKNFAFDQGILRLSIRADKLTDDCFEQISLFDFDVVPSSFDVEDTIRDVILRYGSPDIEDTENM